MRRQIKNVQCQQCGKQAYIRFGKIVDVRIDPITGKPKNILARVCLSCKNK